MSIFADEICVVTGAASGLGAAVTKSLVQLGAKVLALDVQDEAGEQMAAELGVQYAHCDVSQTRDWGKIVALLEELGTPKFVHLNAGIQIAPPDAPLEDYQFANMQLDRYRRMMGVNVDGVVFGLQALLPLLSSGAGVVVTSSLAGITPYAVDPLYAMSKHAVSGLVRSLAEPLADRGITINAICPGGIDTAIIPHDQRHPKAVFMTTEHVAGEVLELFTAEETGKTWAKVSQEKAAFIVRAPGDKSAANN
ncbi:MAG: SDR family NAD(P)-dependent oxidoreductase [Gammaproteobacteria bacterium]|nr:SDR family NAD(P)-dependent oxidoreductase [Gammaproteobacteria bacterium]